MKCLYCDKPLKNPKARFCNSQERMRFKRKGESEQITRTLITENPNKDGLKPEQKDNPNRKPEQPDTIKIETLTAPVKVLKFTNESTEKRIEMYKELYPDSTFVPNWVVNGFNSKEEAIREVLKKVRGNTSIASTGLKI